MPAILLRVAIYLVIAFLVGTIAQLATGYHKRRIFTTVILGLLGVAAGDYASRYIGFLNVNFIDISIIWSIAGAVLFILLFRLIRGSW